MLFIFLFICFLFFCFKQKTAYEMLISDWSSDVCSSDLLRRSGGTDTIWCHNQVVATPDWTRNLHMGSVAHRRAHRTRGRPIMTSTIALVDDDQNILTSVTMALEAEGFDVRAYKDGEDALRGLTQRPVDLAVLDIQMPRLDGMELLQRLRKNSTVPVIFLTSNDDEVDEVLGLRMGADDYIKKPFSQRLLIERIRALLRRQDLAADEANPNSDATITRGDRKSTRLNSRH